MKRPAFFSSWLVLVLALAGGGCGKNAGDSFDNLQRGFAHAAPAARDEIEKAGIAFKAGNLLETTAILNQVLTRHELTETELRATRVVFGEITRAVATDPTLDSPEFYQVRGEILKRLYGKH